MAGDPYWYYKVLGLHCDGTNGSTTFTDVGPSPKTVTANGNAQISTAQYPALTGKTSSGYFDGSGDYLSIAPSSDFNFGTGDFTIRMRWRPESLATAQALVYHTDDAGVTGAGEFIIVYNTSLGLRFYLNAGGAGSVAQGSTSGWSTGTWYDVEITRNGTTLTIRRDGTSIASGTCSAQVGTSDKSTYLMGETFDPLYSTGYISEVEFYKGISLHTANFTPSTDPFADEYVSISGTTKDSSGSFASRLVRVYRRDTGALVGSVISNGTTGAYKVIAANSGTTTPLKHFAVCVNATADPPGSPTENALIFDDLTPA